MRTDRRDFLKGVALAGAAVLGPSPLPTRTRPHEEPDPNAYGLLYDSTRCIGCMACMAACKRANDLPAEDPSGMGLHDAPRDLSASTKTVVKEALIDGRQTFYKTQCMHCADPACVSVCMIGALHKGKHGVVAYDPSRCVGCRYCQVACPFDIPKFQWDTPTPRIVKCELCRHRFAQGLGPACAEVCPRKAVVFGTREELLSLARQRLAADPDRYVDHIYGEHEAGGTQVLVLAGVPFSALALPALGDQPMASLSETIQHGIYKGFIAPLVLYALLSGVILRNHRKGLAEDGTREKER